MEFMAALPRWVDASFCRSHNKAPEEQPRHHSFGIRCEMELGDDEYSIQFFQTTSNDPNRVSPIWATVSTNEQF